MYISQCIIAKNEESNIEYCLSHLKSVVDEQIVVDTGSTDRTVEIAESLGAKVFHFDWINDFSAARNFTLDKAKGDWIIFLDCDEYFSDESVPLLKKIINNVSKKRDINGIVCELINIDLNKNVLSVVKNVNARVFRRKNHIRYKNKIHETLHDSRSKEYNYSVLCMDYGDELKIMHNGYDKSIIAEKNKNDRNLDILKDELLKDPEDPHLNIYISKEYYLNKEYEESLKYLEAALSFMNEKSNQELYCAIYSSILYTMEALGKPYEEMEAIFDDAVIKDVDYPDYYRALGLAAYRVRYLDKSIQYFKECIYYCEKYNKKIESLAVGQIFMIYNELLNAYLMKDDKPGIVELSVAILKVNKYDLEILIVLLRTFLTSESEESIISFLRNLYDYNNFKDKIYLYKASEQCKNEKLISYFKGILNEEEKRAIGRL